jgi:hypothetical protein
MERIQRDFADNTTWRFARSEQIRKRDGKWSGRLVSITTGTGSSRAIDVEEVSATQAGSGLREQAGRLEPHRTTSVSGTAAPTAANLFLPSDWVLSAPTWPSSGSHITKTRPIPRKSSDDFQAKKRCLARGNPRGQPSG